VDLTLRIEVLRFEMYVLELEVQGSGSRIQGLGFLVCVLDLGQGLGFRAYGSSKLPTICNEPMSGGEIGRSFLNLNAGHGFSITRFRRLPV